MTAIAPLIILAAMVAIAALAMLFGADSRPGIDQAADGWVGQPR